MAVKIDGLQNAIQYLETKGNDIVEAAKITLSDAATNMEVQAGAAAPSVYRIGNNVIDLKFIRQKINKKVIENGLGYNVGLDVPSQGDQWEAWMEFGTGLSAEQILGGAQYTGEIKTQARFFFRNGEGRIVGQPYLYPAFFRNTANLVSEMEKEIINKLK
jgi:hypothetical protein